MVGDQLDQVCGSSIDLDQQWIKSRFRSTMEKFWISTVVGDLDQLRIKSRSGSRMDQV